MDIVEHDTTHFFYGKFPFKVVLHLGFSSNLPMGLARQQFIRESVREPESPVKRVEGLRAAYYFSTLAETLTFIDGNRSHVCEVHGPYNDAALKQMASNPSFRVRQFLFSEKYRFRAAFFAEKFQSHILPPPKSEIDEWVEDYFDFDHNRSYHTVENDRARYTYKSERKLLVRDEQDMVVVKLRLGALMSAYEECVLYSELSD